jgi:hypothetical protein
MCERTGEGFRHGAEFISILCNLQLGAIAANNLYPINQEAKMKYNLV